MPEPTIPTPTTLLELRALVMDQGRVRVTLTPALVRQVLAHNQPAAPILFEGPLPSDWQPADRATQDWRRRVRVQAAAHVVRLAELIVSGRWDPEFDAPASNGAILFTPNLQIGNGRHRLKAVDLADHPITVYVERCAWGGYMGPPLGPPSSPNTI